MASSRAQRSTWVTRSATAAIPASSWRATPCSPATLARRTVPRGTSPCPPAEVGGQRGSYRWVATGGGGGARAFSETQSPAGKPHHPLRLGMGYPLSGSPRVLRVPSYSRVFSASPGVYSFNINKLVFSQPALTSCPLVSEETCFLSLSQTISPLVRRSLSQLLLYDLTLTIILFSFL